MKKIDYPDEMGVGKIEQLTDLTVEVNARLLRQSISKLNVQAAEIKKLRADNKRLTESRDAARIVFDKLVRAYNNREKPLWAQHVYRVVELAKQWLEENK